MNRPQYLTLEQWAERKFGAAKIPHPNTLRAWARGGKIVPRPVKMGSGYLVIPDALHEAEIDAGVRLGERV